MPKYFWRKKRRHLILPAELCAPKIHVDVLTTGIIECDYVETESL